jgi:hypothetical protein
MIKKGEVVRVKPGVQDVDFGIAISGWQGRVTEVRPDGVDVKWDSQTLKQMPASMITACEEQGLDWTIYGFGPEDLEPAEARDTLADVKRAVADIWRDHAWDWLEEEGTLIREVLSGIDPHDEASMMHAWYLYMTEHLTFPFAAKVHEFQERGPLRVGDRLRVERIVDVVVPYGILVKVRKGRKSHVFPLCDLAVLNPRSELHDIVQSYRVWYANCR